MLGSPFKFSTINRTTVPYDLTNSTSNFQSPYQLGAGSTIETFFILPPKDLTIYNYTQNGNPILESGFWNNNGQFSNNQTILGSYGSPYGCLVYGGISECIGFGQFIMTNPLTYLQDEPFINNIAYHVPSMNPNGDLFYSLYMEQPSCTSGSISCLSPYIIPYRIDGVFYTGVSNTTKFAYPIDGNFYPNYTFYNASISLNQYFNTYTGAVMQINAGYGYYIPIYQGTRGYFGKGRCNTNPGTILNLIFNSTHPNSCYTFTEDNLTLALSTQAIQVNIPNHIYHWWQDHCAYSNGTKFYLYEKWNASNNGYKNILIHQNQSTTWLPFQNGISVYPSIPSSGSQTNAFAFFDLATNETGSIPGSVPPGPIQQSS